MIMDKLLQLLNELLGILKEKELKNIVEENPELRAPLEDLLIEIWRVAGFRWTPVVIRETIGLDETSISKMAYATANQLRNTPVTLIKCREIGDAGNPCDRGLELDIKGGILRLTCPAHGSWEIATAKKV
jgi:hypothetical protein